MGAYVISTVALEETRNVFNFSIWFVSLTRCISRTRLLFFPKVKGIERPRGFFFFFLEINHRKFIIEEKL